MDDLVLEPARDVVDLHPVPEPARDVVDLKPAGNKKPKKRRGFIYTLFFARACLVAFFATSYCTYD